MRRKLISIGMALILTVLPVGSAAAEEFLTVEPSVLDVLPADALSLQEETTASGNSALAEELVKDRTSAPGEDQADAGNLVPTGELMDAGNFIPTEESVDAGNPVPTEAVHAEDGRQEVQLSLDSGESSDDGGELLVEEESVAEDASGEHVTGGDEGLSGSIDGAAVSGEDAAQTEAAGQEIGMDADLILSVEEVEAPDMPEPWADAVCGTIEDGPYQLSDSGDALNAGFSAGPMLFGSAQFEGFYGDQLDGNARAVYEAMDTQFRQNQSAEKLTVTLADSFHFTADCVTDSAGKVSLDLKNCTVYQNEILPQLRYSVQAAFDAYIYDYPEVFWLAAPTFSWSISYLRDESSATAEASVREISLTPGEKYEGAKGKISQFDEAVNGTVAALQENLPAGASRFDTVKVIHDYICNNVSYDSTLSLPHIRSAAGVFLEGGVVVCEGYAKAFEVLCRRFGIECALIPGGAKKSDGSVEGHMWNYVRMEDGNWYMIDTTWDDQRSYISEKYFLTGSGNQGFNALIGEERSLYTKFSKSDNTMSFTLPVLSPEHYHMWEESSRIDATCSADGSTSYACSRKVFSSGSGSTACTAARTEPITERPPHTFEYVANNDATCTEGGTKTGTCSVCKAKETVTDSEQPALGHSWDDGMVTKAPTCTEAGIRMYTCTREGCEAAEEEALQPLGHEWDAGTVTKEPTCTETGILTYRCLRDGCGAADPRNIPATDHVFRDYEPNNDATCTEDGTKTRTCEACGKKETVPDPEQLATGHIPEEDGAAAATCTTSGLTAGSHCSACGTVLVEQKEIPVLSHSWDSGVVTKAPTCTEPGIRTYKCIRKGCGATNTGEIPANGHSLVIDAAVAETCTKFGLTEGSHCSVCKTVLNEQKEVPAFGHSLVTDAAVAATCTVSGLTAGSHCSVCGTVLMKQEEVPAFGHSWDSGTVTKSPACTESGVRTYQCTREGCEATDPREIPALGHSFRKYVSDKNATVLKDGTKTAVCSRCRTAKDTVKDSGSKLKAKITLNTKSIVLKTGQSTTCVKVSGLRKGDKVSSWKSSKTSVARVSQKGKITAGKKTGSAVITVRTRGGAKATIKVKVQKTTVRTKSISKVPSRLTLKKGKSAVLYPVLTPLTSSEKVKFVSSNKKVVTVTGKGKITARKKGTATITVKSGKKSVKCKVTVK